MSENKSLNSNMLELIADAKRYRWIAADPRYRASLEWIDTKSEMDEYIDDKIKETDG